VAVLCLVGFLGILLTFGTIASAIEGDPEALPWALGALGVLALTVVIWRNGRGAPLARLLGLGAVIAVLVVSGSTFVAVLVGVLVVGDLLSHGRRPTA
jgi:NhaP-type Na+/H+ or K+/H+ antiporter